MPDSRRERIERRAYEIWESEGRPHGRHDEHWRRAAAEIDAEAVGSEETSAGGTQPPPADSAPVKAARARRVTKKDAAPESAPAKPTATGKRTARKPASGDATRAPRRGKSTPPRD
jgi:hypothetical protein